MRAGPDLTSLSWGSSWLTPSGKIVRQRVCENYRREQLRDATTKQRRGVPVRAKKGREGRVRHIRELTESERD